MPLLEKNFILNEKITGETPEVRSNKKKPREKKREKIEKSRKKREKKERKREKTRGKERKRGKRERKERKKREKRERRKKAVLYYTSCWDCAGMKFYIVLLYIKATFPDFHSVIDAIDVCLQLSL